MVWFQCEDCGESLKKPKLPNHFLICSAAKLSCFDCCQTFSQESAQGHTQCISESDKYGPKGQGKAASNEKTKANKPNKHPEVDLNVGLSSRKPWECSLCKTRTTSQQTLMLHADGKKHRTKAWAFHKAQNKPSQTTEPAAQECKEIAATGEDKEPSQTDAAKVPVLGKGETQKEGKNSVAQGVGLTSKKRDRDELSTSTEIIVKEGKTANPIIGKDIEKPEGLPQSLPKKLKLKKLVTRQLKEAPDGEMKLKKLQKLVIKALPESGLGEDKSQLLNMVMDKINSSSRFVVDNKYVRLTSKVADC